RDAAQTATGSFAAAGSRPRGGSRRRRLSRGRSAIRLGLARPRGPRQKQALDTPPKEAVIPYVEVSMRISRRFILSVVPNRFALTALAVAATGRLVSARADDDLTRAERFIGKADAKVTVHEFFSLTCTHCAAFAIGTLTEIKKNLID